MSADANISREQRPLHHSQVRNDVCLWKNPQSSFFGFEIVIVALISPSKMQLLEFDWRSAFRGLAPHMAHCVKVVLDDACAKSLQEEEALHSSGHATIAMSPVPERTTIAVSPVPERTTSAAASTSLHHRGDCFGTYLEREVPKRIAKVPLDVAQNRVTAC